MSKTDDPRSDFLRKTGKSLTCPLCGGDDFLVPTHGIEQRRVVCSKCGHFMWFNTASGMEQDGFDRQFPLARQFKPLPGNSERAP